VSDAKQCGHQAGKVTIPHEDFLAKINAVRYAFLELGVENGIIVARTDSLGASLTQKVPVSREPGDLAEQYCQFLETTPVDNLDELKDGDVTFHRGGAIVKPTRLDNGMFAFRPDTGFDRVVLDLRDQPAPWRGPAVDRDREAQRQADRRHGQRGARDHTRRQAGL
jgi:isocitrate lyase